MALGDKHNGDKILSPEAIEILIDVFNQFDQSESCLEPYAMFSNWIYKHQAKLGMLSPYQVMAKGQLSLLRSFVNSEINDS